MIIKGMGGFINRGWLGCDHALIGSVINLQARKKATLAAWGLRIFVD